jgi:hypothetical protein
MCRLDKNRLDGPIGSCRLGPGNETWPFGPGNTKLPAFCVRTRTHLHPSRPLWAASANWYWRIIIKKWKDVTGVPLTGRLYRPSEGVVVLSSCRFAYCKQMKPIINKVDITEPGERPRLVFGKFWDTGYPDRGLSWSSSVPPDKFQDSSSTAPWPPPSIFFAVHLSPYHYTLYIICDIKIVVK